MTGPTALIPPWTCHDGEHWYRAVHPDHVLQRPDQPNDEVPVLVRLLPITDSAGNPSSPFGEGPDVRVEAETEGWFPYRYSVRLWYRSTRPGVVEWRVVASDTGRAWTADRMETRVQTLMDEYYDRAARDGRGDRSPAPGSDPLKETPNV